MTTKKHLEIINRKLDLTLKAVSIIPIFVSSVNNKDPNRQWKQAVKAWEKIEKEYKEVLEHEDYINTPSIKD